MNVKVPKELRPLLKKELIRKSLKTSDGAEAVRRLKFESFKTEAAFENLRRKLRAESAPAKQLSEISTQAAHDLIFRYFKKLEKMSEHWWYNQAPKLNDEELWEALETLGLDERFLTDGDDGGRQEDGSAFLDSFLKEHRILCPKDSHAYRTLRPLFLRAQLENTRRAMDRIEKGTTSIHDDLFRDVFAHTKFTSVGQSVTLYSRSCDAVVRVFDESGSMVETHEQIGEFKEP